MLSTWFDKFMPHNLSWGLVDRHRARYFQLISLLLFIYCVGAFALWFYLGGEITGYTTAFWVVAVLVVLLPSVLLYVDKQLLHAASVLLAGQFILINGLIMVSGNLSSPMMLNLFYLPLVALLSGNIRLVMLTSGLSVFAIMAHFLLAEIPLALITYELPGRHYWFQWNLVACIAISGTLALAYEHTVEEMYQLLIQEQKLSERELFRDDLTGLANRQMLEHYTESLTFRSQRLSQRFSVVAINIRNFSEINKTYGHHCGDQALKFLAKRLQEITRKTDLVVRLRDDRFIIVLANIKHEENADTFVEKLSRSLSEALVTNKHELMPSYDIGVVNFPKNGASLEELLNQLEDVMRPEPKMTEGAYVEA